MIDPAPPIPSGDTAFHAWCRWAQRGIERLRTGDTPGAATNRTTRGVSVLRKPGGAAQLAGRQRYRVKGVYSTYLVCRTWNGEVEGMVDKYVRKPPHLCWYAAAWPGMDIEGKAVTFTHQLRDNNIDGQRKASQEGEADQIEIILPLWQWGINDVGDGTGVLGGYDEIWASTPAGGTGIVTVAETAWEGAAAPAPVGTVITLLDDNCNGRYWEQVG